jgi:putative ABC transport system permease protein
MDQVENKKRVSAKVALGETFRLALDALRSHKLRSFLTLLGIILAVATLVGVMSIVSGLNGYISDKVANLGANAFVVNRFGIITNQDQFLKAQKRPLVTYDDYQALLDHMKLAQAVAVLEVTTLDVRGGGQLDEDTNVFGVSPNYVEVRAIGIDRGRAISDADDEHRSAVCVLGMDVVNKLFPNVDPLGKFVRAGPEEFQVIGVTTPLGTVFGQPQDNYIQIPFHSYEKSWHTAQNSLTFFVEARSPELIDAAEDEVRVVLRARRHIPYDDPDNFGIIGSSSITNLWQQLTGNIFGLAIWLTSVFLVVGGIVIMNIMLASVTERTREIGIRKALGARRSHIIMQFLVESAVLASVGGMLGIGMAEGITALVNASGVFPMSTPIKAVIIGLLLSTSVGLFFGIYPAMRAAKLDPIEALRLEN